MKRKMIGSQNQIAHYDLQGHVGRLFFATDVHGEFSKLHFALRDVGFSPSHGDLLFLGGDLVDRGPESKDVLDWLYEPWVHSICGNHEALHIEAFRNLYDYRTCHSAATLGQHGGLWAFDMARSDQQKYIDMFKSMPLAMELQTDFGIVGIIHAEVPYANWESWKNATKTEFENHCVADAQWARRKYRAKNSAVVEGIDVVLVGHTPTDSYKPEVLGNVVYSDCGAVWGNDFQLVEINKELIEGVKHARERNQEAGETRVSRSKRL